MGKNEKRLTYIDYGEGLSRYLKKKLNLDTIKPARNREYFIELSNSLIIGFSYPFQNRAKLFHSRQHILKIRDKSTNLDKYEYYPGVVINYWAILDKDCPDFDRWIFMPMADVLKAIRNYEPIAGSEKYISNNHDWFGSIKPTKFFWMGDKNSESNYIPVSIDNFEIIKKNTMIITPATDNGRVHNKNLQFEIEEPWQALQAAQLQIEYNFIQRFVASLLTKPFVIFTGLSGSGKTKLALAFAQWLCAEENQCKIIPVGADWTNREPLLGFPNALEIGKYVKPDNGVLDLLLEASRTENTDKPYFLILDEMNLSHVERYFADFLSAMESGETIPLHSDGLEWKTTDGNWKEGIPDKILVPQNLFIIGTVNIDETTYMFSPKVLDRAGVLEFRITEEEMQKYLANPVKPDLESIKGAGGEMAADFLKKALQDYMDFDNQEKITECLNKFFTELKKAGAEFGYRSASEIFRFAAILPTVSKEITTDEIIDAAVIQKLLPKLHGSRRKLESVLKILAGLCLNDASKAVEILNEKKSDYTGDPRVQLPLSFEKISRMYHRALNDGFTSFAEA
jgi:5-methylcytosine-specific restriction protein B